MNQYLVITEEFAFANNGYRSGCNVFSYGITNDFRYVVSLNSSIEFPDIFIGHDFPLVELGFNDFPREEA